MVQPPENIKEFSALVRVVEALRGPKGCPWDREQTHATLTQYAIEEAHELAEAIETGDTQDLVEELGDVLLQVVLHAEIARQEQSFDIHNVIETLNEKMIRRHPHVFSNTKVGGSKDVVQNWEKIKAGEKENKEKKSSEDFGVPITIPALQRAHKIGEKTKRLNFDWSTPNEVLDKVEEELAELKEAIGEGSEKNIRHELGDLLFSIAQLGRHLGVEPEQSLRQTNQRFGRRFATMLEIAKNENLDFTKLETDELEELWQKAKDQLRGSE